MTNLRLSITLALALCVGAGTGCGGGEDQASNNSVTPVNAANAGINKTKANGSREELGMKINFAWETEDLAWRSDDSAQTLTAAFRLDPENAKKLSDQLQARSPGAPKNVSVEDWFPAELVAQGETSGGSSVEGTAFPADDFYQPPFTQGTITRIKDTDYFVIEVSGN